MSKYKVLFVDDEPDIIEFLSYNFKREGFEVYTARDRQEGLETARFNTPDIIVSDILMPRSSGIDMCSRLKEEIALRNVPVIFLSATPDDMVALSALESGGSRFLSKPIHVSILLGAVKHILERRASKGPSA